MLIKKMQKASSTHNGNGGEVDIPKPEVEIDNSDNADMLMDPEDTTGGSTHTSITASLEDQDISTMDNNQDPAEGYLPTEESANPQCDTTSIADIPVDQDPAAGYLPMQATAEADPEDLENSQDIQPMEAPDEVSAAEDDMDWDEDSVPDDEMDMDPDSSEETDEDTDQYNGDEDPDTTEDDDTIVTSADDMDLLDVDGTDDNGDDLAFATIKATVHVLKANRIIASMTKKVAKASSRDDVYLTDRFADVVEAEVKTNGLRKGLRSMGFALAKVNVTSQKVVQARVEKGIKVQASAIRKVNADNQKVFQQSLAIAAVGINRQFFKDSPNELKAALQEELQHAGVRGGTRLVNKIFGEYGPTYAKQLVELATKIAAMPEDSRNGMCEALDMTCSDMEENPFGSADGEFADGAGDTTDDGFNADESFDDDFIDDDIENANVHTAFARPATQLQAANKRVPALLNPRNTNYNLTVASVLRGDIPLPFTR